ncbi:MAG TPA: ATP-dependent RecD-like DNA helicase [Clostridiales bacterium]|nr:ATP-dependent RecD-like DNA helicase [Clostridiales bacterium]
MEDNITLTGRVYEIIYQNPANGYTVIEIDSPSDGLFTATGYMPYAAEGENLALTGSWCVHPDYGEQFRVISYETILPTDENSILEYLSSGVIYGVKAATAKKIVDYFGCEALDIMIKDPMRLSEIKGISVSRAEKIGKSYLELQSMQSIVMFLQQYGLPASLAVKIHRTLGADAISKIKENPYVLCESIDGIAFKTADSIAYARGISKNSPSRLRSGIKYILKQAAYNGGHTYLPKDVLISEVALKLSVKEEDILDQIDVLCEAKELVLDEEDCYLSYFFEAERYVASRIRSLGAFSPPLFISDEEIDRIIDSAEKDSLITLDCTQRLAVLESTRHNAVVITGGPGTGKTTTINTIIKVLSDMHLSIALAAPTGRAAKRMTELCGIEAKTIHRLLCVQPDEDSQAVRFTHNENNPLPYDAIILDEVSMVDIQLMNSFLRAVKKGAKVIFSGDSDQLPSVGPGNVLEDFCRSGIIPVIRLTHIFRQALESLIITNAHKINAGIMPEIDRRDNDFFFMRRASSEDIALTICDLYKNRIPKSYGINPTSSIQILCPSKKGVAGSVNLNRLLQECINPKSDLKTEYPYGKMIFRTGDKVMQIKNNYDILWEKDNGEKGSGIFNGDMGIIDSISVKDRQMIIIFDDDKRTVYSLADLDCLDLAYAITVHKSQGSEFHTVIMPICRTAPMLMCRNLLYTAVTRAKNMVVMVGSISECATMVKNNDEKKRFSGLLKRLNETNNIIGG